VTSARATLAGVAVRRASLAPPLRGLAVAAVAFGAYLLLDALGSTRPSPIGASGWGRSDLRVAAAVSLLTGYAFFASAHARRALVRQLVELRALLGGDDAEHAARLRDGEAAFSLPRAGPAAAAGVAGGMALLAIGRNAEAGASGAPLLGADLAWWLPVIVVLGWMVGKGVFVAIASGRFFARIGAQIAEIDLLDLSAVAPFARHGLGLALLWLVGTSIGSLVVVEVPSVIPIAVVLIGIAGVAAAAFFLPLRGVRWRIRLAKETELRRTNDAIRAERARLLADAGRGGASPLDALLAWRGFVESVREWPLDASTLMRFGLYVSLAFGSWLGGAVVDHALGILLG
jgi:hypothetical protein